MTDDEILAAAVRIKAKRLNKARLATFLTKNEVMIRWDNPGASFGEAYTSIIVPADEIQGLVTAYFTPLIGD